MRKLRVILHFTLFEINIFEGEGAKSKAKTKRIVIVLKMKNIIIFVS